MKKFLLPLLLAALPLSSFAASGTAIPGGNQSTPFVIDKPGSYYLAGNRTMTNTEVWGAIQITTDNVTLDLNGFSLGFSGTTTQGISGHAISVMGDNVEIRNGVIHTAPGDAIHSEAYYLRMIDLRVLNTHGISADGRSALAERCHVSETHGDAIRVGNSSTVRDCVVMGATKKGSLYGRGIWAGSDAIITGCSVSFTDSTGIVCYGGGVLVENCRVADANWKESDYDAGIVTYDGSATIRRCLVTRASGTGIRIGALSVGTVLEDNVVKRTQTAAPAAGYGIVCLNSSTILQNNKGVANAGGFIAGQYVNAGGNLGN